MEGGDTTERTRTTAPLSSPNSITSTCGPINDGIRGNGARELVVIKKGSIIRFSVEIEVSGSRRSVSLPPQGSLRYPTSTGEPTLTWLGPNQTIPDSTVPSGSLTLSAKRAARLIKLPNELPRFGREIAASIIRKALVSRLARRNPLASRLAHREQVSLSRPPFQTEALPAAASAGPTATIREGPVVEVEIVELYGGRSKLRGSSGTGSMKSRPLALSA